MNNHHSNIKINYTIGNQIAFLDVKLTKTDNQLNTAVHHKENTEPYIVPFRSDHARHIFRGVIYGAILRAVKYSTTLLDCRKELREITLLLLYNG